jgi:hypothetical protein
MVVGFRTDIGPDRFVNLVEIATLDPPVAAAPGTPISPHGQVFTAGWTNILQPSPRIYPVTSSRYPIRIRVYDQEGGLLKESQARLPWEFATNGRGPRDPREASPENRPHHAGEGSGGRPPGLGQSGRISVTAS